jgi:hypothetical protein
MAIDEPSPIDRGGILPVYNVRKLMDEGSGGGRIPDEFAP